MKIPKNISGNLYADLKYIKQCFFNSNRYKLTRRIVGYLQSEDCLIPATDKQLLLKCFSKTLANPIGYPYIREYLYKRINVSWDSTNSLYFVYHNKKKLYFRKGLTKTEVRNIYNELCIEQDMRSPHSYFAFPIEYQHTDIAVDIGAAEGIWALDIVEKVEKIYLFECEKDWIEALQATFEPWSEKVCIVNKYVTDYNDENNTTLDDFFAKIKIFPTIIKVDIEGAEAACMKGASVLLNQYIHHALLCTYHNYDDHEILKEMMKNHHFKIQSSNGYMTFYYQDPNYSCKDVSRIFRKGLIYACK